MKYVTYKRVSTDKQGRSGLGIDAQERDIRLFLSNYAEADAEVLAEHVEVQTGSRDNREELNKALDVCRKEGATLLVSKLDRLSRKVSFIAQLIEDKKVNFRVAQMPHADKFQLHIYSALAEQERDFISKRTKAAMAEARAKGKVFGGLRPEAEARHQAVSQEADRHAQKVIGVIGPLRRSGSTLQEVADRLNELGVPTARGGKWHPATVQRAVDRQSG